jgi:predicted TIM-barrel enzyme
LTDDPELAAQAERLRAEAGALPSPEEIKVLAAAAVAHGATADMSKEDIHEVAKQAIEASRQMTVILERLACLLPEPPGGQR